MMKNVTRNHW